MTDIAIRGLPVPGGLLLLFGSVFAALAISSRFDKGEGAATERRIWLLTALMLLAARVAFVFRYRDIYMQEPLRIVDFRDGGFRPAVGIVAGIAVSIWIGWRQASRRNGLLAALAAGCIVWAAGSTLQSIASQDHAMPEAALGSRSCSPTKARRLRPSGPT